MISNLDWEQVGFRGKQAKARATRHTLALRPDLKSEWQAEQNYGILRVRGIGADGQFDGWVAVPKDEWIKKDGTPTYASEDPDFFVAFDRSGKEVRIPVASLEGPTEAQVRMWNPAPAFQQGIFETRSLPGDGPESSDPVFAYMRIYDEIWNEEKAAGNLAATVQTHSMGRELAKPKRVMDLLAIPPEKSHRLFSFVPDLRFYDLIIINSSGGKDSMAILDYVSRIATEQGVRERVVVVHADLGAAEHEGVDELVKEQAAHIGLPVEILTPTKEGKKIHLLEAFRDRSRLLASRGQTGKGFPRNRKPILHLRFQDLPGVQMVSPIPRGEIRERELDEEVRPTRSDSQRPGDASSGEPEPCETVRNGTASRNQDPMARGPVAPRSRLERGKGLGHDQKKRAETSRGLFGRIPTPFVPSLPARLEARYRLGGSGLPSARPENSPISRTKTGARFYQEKTSLREVLDEANRDPAFREKVRKAKAVLAKKSGVPRAANPSSGICPFCAVKAALRRNPG